MDERSFEGWSSQFALFAAVFRRAGLPINNLIGFIDGKLWPVCRPGKYQNVLYSGHKRIHGLKLQGIIFPNGAPPPGRLVTRTRSHTPFDCRVSIRVCAVLCNNVPKGCPERGNIIRSQMLKGLAPPELGPPFCSMRMSLQPLGCAQWPAGCVRGARRPSACGATSAHRPRADRNTQCNVVVSPPSVTQESCHTRSAL
jgi:hypothetical protein